VIIMKRSRADAMGIKPLATIFSMASMAKEPRRNGEGRVTPFKFALARAGLTMDNVDVF